MTNKSPYNQKHSSHERDAVEPTTLSEDGGHHEGTSHLDRNEAYQDHRAMPKIGSGLRDADTYHILAQALPLLGIGLLTLGR